MMSKYLPTFALLTVCLYGCAPGPVLEDDFGEAARSMVYHQIANPETIVNPDEEPVSGMSGKKGQRVLTEYNDDVSRPADTGATINLNIGGDK